MLFQFNYLCRFTKRWLELASTYHNIRSRKSKDDFCGHSFIAKLGKVLSWEEYELLRKTLNTKIHKRYSDSYQNKLPP